MAYLALGRTVFRNANTTITVKIEIVDDRTGNSVRFQEYNLPAAGFAAALRAAVKADLQALVAAESDATLNAAIVNVQLGSI